MDGMTTGAGLAALGFWLFVGGAMAAGMWDNIRKRDAQHETLRRVIESGQTIDDDLTNKLLMLTGSNANLERDLQVSGLLLLAIAPGLAVFGWILSIVLAEKLLGIMLAISALLIFLGIGFLVSARVSKRWSERNGMSADQ